MNLVQAHVTSNAPWGRLIPSGRGRKRRSQSLRRWLPRPRPRVAPGPSAVAELVEALLVEAEIVRELVEHRDADLLFERLRVGAVVTDERPSVDGDPSGQELVLLEQPVEVGLLVVLLLDDDGDVLEPGGELRRQRVERPADVLLEAHQRGRSGRRFATRYTVRIPNAKPPMCANTATPPVWLGWVIPTPPCHTWSAIQMPRNQTAGISRRKIR